MADLIAFYSRRGQNYFDGEIKEVKKGNTEIVAEKLQEMTGAEVFQIKQLVEYSDNYKICAEEAERDFNNNARPELDEYLQEPEHRPALVYLPAPELEPRHRTYQNHQNQHSKEPEKDQETAQDTQEHPQNSKAYPPNTSSPHQTQPPNQHSS